MYQALTQVMPSSLRSRRLLYASLAILAVGLASLKPAALLAIEGYQWERAQERRRFRARGGRQGRGGR
jgi:hypothetical protein